MLEIFRVESIFSGIFKNIINAQVWQLDSYEADLFH